MSTSGSSIELAARIVSGLTPNLAAIMRRFSPSSTAWCCGLGGFGGAGGAGWAAAIVAISSTGGGTSLRLSVETTGSGALAPEASAGTTAAGGGAT